MYHRWYATTARAKRALLCVVVVALQVGWLGMVGCGAPGPYKLNMIIKVPNPQNADQYQPVAGQSVSWVAAIFLSRDRTTPWEINNNGEWSPITTKVTGRYNWLSVRNSFSMPNYTEVFLVDGKSDAAKPEDAKKITTTQMIVRFSLNSEWVSGALGEGGLKLTLANANPLNFNLDCAFINRVVSKGQVESESTPLAAFKGPSIKIDIQQAGPTDQVITLDKDPNSPSQGKCP